MLEAAAAVFFEHGYWAASIDMVIDRIGGSKQTIYNEFGNKEGLFTALVTEIADKALAQFEPMEIEGADARETLLRLARSLMAIYTSANLIGVYRAVVTEAHRFPDLAQAVYAKGPGRAAARLKRVLDELESKGDIGPIDTMMAADQFIGMIRDNLHLRIVLGLSAMPTAEELDRRAISAVEIFLNGVGSRPKRA